MKTILLALSLAVTAACCLTAETPTPKVDPGPSSHEKDIYKRWSVVGDWNTTHPYWTHILTLKPDGTMATDDKGDSGHWVLTAEAGTPLLVLKWDRWSTESLTMVGPNHFRGQIKPGSYIDMRRGE